MKLSERQAKFVDHYALSGKGAESARLAGYGERGARVQACHLLANPNVSAAIRERQAQYQAELQITKQDVIAGILSAINLAREQGNPAAMVQGCSALARMLGYFQPERHHVEVTADVDAMKAKFLAMSDAELLAIARKS